MLTENHIREGLSRAYILAVAHRAGFNCSVREFDYGIDGTFHEITRRGGRYIESGYKIDFQAKAASSTNSVTVRDSSVDYDMEVKTQHDLAMDVGTPRILILMVLPENQDEWLTITEDALALKRCAWWASLEGQTPTTNKNTIMVPVPRTQIFDVAALSAMMERVRAGAPV